MKLLEKAGYDDSPYADRLRAACFWPDSKQRIHYLTLAADRGDYLAIDELLAYYARSATRDFAKKLYSSAEALDKLWHNVFLLFASAELLLPWFTHENLRLVYDRLQ